MIALPRGDDLEAPGDAFPFVIHHGQYVLAGVDVQRLLVKSVRFPKVLAIEMPIDRGLTPAGNRLEYRATTLSIELLGDQHLRIRIGIKQRERGAATGRVALQSARNAGNGRYSACTRRK